MFEPLPTHFFTQEAITQVQSEHYFITSVYQHDGVIASKKREYHMSHPTLLLNYFCTNLGERLPLEEVDFLEVFESENDSGSSLIKTGEEWFFSSRGETYTQDDVSSVGLSEQIYKALNPAFTPVFSLLVLSPPLRYFEFLKRRFLAFFD